ncbi:MAG: hypothetical protein M0Z95_00580 [Actinomycetota bacterium]|nr:hypothetical protein [Actinomycetota bacterium]
MNEVAGELGCDGHTVSDTVVAYDEDLLATDEERMSALGHDEMLMVRVGSFHRQNSFRNGIEYRTLDVSSGSFRAIPW